MTESSLFLPVIPLRIHSNCLVFYSLDTSHWCTVMKIDRNLGKGTFLSVASTTKYLLVLGSNKSFYVIRTSNGNLIAEVSVTSLLRLNCQRETCLLNNNFAFPRCIGLEFVRPRVSIAFRKHGCKRTCLKHEMAKWLFYAVEKAFESNFMQLAPGFFWVSKGHSSFHFLEDPITLRVSHLTLQVYFCSQQLSLI